MTATRKNQAALSSGDALREIVRRTGLRLCERDLNNLVRRLPIDECPPIVRNRRAWGPAHVEAVVRFLADQA